MKVLNFIQKRMFPIVLLIVLILVLELFLVLIPNSKNYLVYNSKDVSDFKKPSDLKNCYTLDELNEKDIKVEYIEDRIDFKYNDKKLDFKKPIILSSSRIYISINEFIKYFDVESYSESSDTIKFNSITEFENNKTINKIEINLSKNNLYIDGDKYLLRENKIKYNDDIYLSLFECTKIFNLVTNWDYKNKSITFYNNLSNKTKEPKKDTGKKALLRLEDMMPSEETIDLGKTRVIIDFLYDNNVPFHLSWIPKYVNPVKGIKNDPVNNYSIYNLDFMYTLDYAMDKNCIIGLHGYTHQYDYGISGADFEFGKRGNTDLKITRELIEKSIQSSEELNIPISYYEFPHYSATKEQFKIAEEYFDILYENLPSKSGQYEVEYTKNKNRIISYIPTPFYYPKKIDGSDIIKTFDKITKESLISFFVHPILEFESIKKVSSEGEYPVYEHSENSALHNILNELDKRNITFTNIFDIK